MKKAKLTGVLAAIVLGLVVILQNTQAVETRFLFLRFTAPNAVLLGLALLVGVAIGILLALVVGSKKGAAGK